MDTCPNKYIVYETSLLGDDIQEFIVYAEDLDEAKDEAEAGAINTVSVLRIKDLCGESLSYMNDGGNWVDLV